MLNEIEIDTNIKKRKIIFKIFKYLTHSFQPCKQESISVAEKLVKLMFYDAALVELIMPALKHLTADMESTNTFTELTIHLCSLSENSINFSSNEWEFIQSCNYYLTQQDEVKIQYFHSIQTISIFYLENKVAIFLIKSIKHIPWWISGSPLQEIFNWWLITKNLQLTHAAAIAYKNKAIIFAGRGGSGKSTTTLACIEQGMQYISEDYCILSPDKPSRVYSIYNSAKLEQKTVEKFPTYKNYIQNLAAYPQEKALLFYNNIFPEKIAVHAEIIAIIGLKITENKEPFLCQTDESLMLSKLLSSTVIQLPSCDRRSHDVLLDVVKNNNCYELALSSNMEKNIDIIKGLVA